MQEMDNNLDEEIRLWQEKLFKRSIRRPRKSERLLNLTGSANNLQCLEISAGDGILSQSLRALGGSWKTMVATQEAADSLAHTLNEPSEVITEALLPFAENSFDRVVIVDALKSIDNDMQLIQECHRVLKNDGWVIISEERRCVFSLVPLLRRLLGISPVAEGHKRNGYQSNELFNILRDGFDVPELACYSNSLLETLSALCTAIQRSILNKRYWLIPAKPGQDELYRYQKLHTLSGIAYPLLWIAALLEFLPGHRYLLKSRRRHWRPRRQPKLIDGRSIAEAAINTKIGTAAPF